MKPDEATKNQSWRSSGARDYTNITSRVHSHAQRCPRRELICLPDRAIWDGILLGIWGPDSSNSRSAQRDSPRYIGSYLGFREKPPFPVNMQTVVATVFTALLILRALSNRSLTSFGIVAAVLTAIAHAYHPWSVFFALLVVFFLGGTAVTKVCYMFYFLSACSSSPSISRHLPKRAAVLESHDALSGVDEHS